MTVCSINYPLAPEHPFPQALIAVLRAVSWMAKEEGVETLHILGDSAGGNLATMASSLLCNRT